MIPAMISAWFSARPIKQKLTILFAGTSSLALLGAGLVLWIYESRTYRDAMAREMKTMSAMLSDSSAAALAFHDRRAAAETLALMRAEPRVLAVCLYAIDGSSVAGGTREYPCPANPGRERAGFEAGRFIVVETPRLEGQPEGRLWLCADLSELSARLHNLAWTFLAVTVGAVLLAIAISAFLQRLISRPILNLTAIAKQVSENRDYSIRATHTAGDELGTLVDRFNEMMDQIHQRDVALEEAQDVLEDRVRERTQELEEEISRRRDIEADLMAARDIAEASNRAKSAFLANMSHELRTPLNAIIGYSELLEEDEIAAQNESGVADLRRIQGAARHLLEIIQDILDLSKIEAGRMSLNMQRMSARSLMADLSVAEPLARRNNNRLVVEQSDCDCAVDVDPIRFRQSLLNLLSNACKFTENGTVTVSLTRQTEGASDWACWTVRDTGPGIAPPDLARLFKSFSQLDSSATRKHGGTGLGLAISQNFCQMMGGKISVKSQPGLGSAFTIRLPAREGNPGDLIDG